MGGAGSNRPYKVPPRDNAVFAAILTEDFEMLKQIIVNKITDEFLMRRTHPIL